MPVDLKPTDVIEGALAPKLSVLQAPKSASAQPSPSLLPEPQEAPSFTGRIIVMPAKNGGFVVMHENGKSTAKGKKASGDHYVFADLDGVKDFLDEKFGEPEKAEKEPAAEAEKEAEKPEEEAAEAEAVQKLEKTKAEKPAEEELAPNTEEEKEEETE